MRKFAPYHLMDKFVQIIEKVRRLAPEGLEEIRRYCSYAPCYDLKLYLGPYKVIHVLPLPSNVNVFIQWRKVLANREIYEETRDFQLYEDSLGYFEIDGSSYRGWKVTGETDLDDEYVDILLKTGMRLVVGEIKRLHPRLQ
jgi:hypothetical protein